MSEVREGYKMTELGEIPNEWNVFKLNGLALKITDGSHTSPIEIDESRFKICSVKHMKKDHFDYENALSISEEDYLKLKNNGCNPMDGDVLLSKDGTIGKTFVFNQSDLNIVLLSSIAIIRCNKELLLPDFLKYFIENPNTILKLVGMKSGSAIKRIVLRDISNLLVVLPDLQEQQKIASILSTVDEQIDETEQLIVKTKELKKGLMQQLLTKGIGHTEFKQSELGEIPTSWSINKLGDLLNFVGSGVTPKGGREVYTNEGILFIRSQNVYPKGLKLDDVAYITVDIHKKMSRTIVKSKDVLLNITGASIGRCTIFPSNLGEANVNQHVCILRAENLLNPQYLMFFMNSTLGQNQILKEQLGQTREGLNFQQIRKFSITLPSLEEQQKIVSILSTVDEQIDNYEQEKVKYEELKKGLMQQLLTGQVRVKI